MINYYFFTLVTIRNPAVHVYNTSCPFDSYVCIVKVSLLIKLVAENNKNNNRQDNTFKGFVVLL